MADKPNKTVDLITETFPSLKDVVLSEPFPPANVKLTYGTAGFRTKAELLDSTFLRMGILASLRSRLHDGAAVGLMVTASHNAEPDNGIKMVDIDGGMLTQSWEKYAYSLANASPENVISELVSIIHAQGEENIQKLCQVGGHVFVGLDTRATSPKLSALAQKGISIFGATSQELGLVTTPQLHHVVRMVNISKGFHEASGVVEAHRWASLSGYNDMLSNAYLTLTRGSESPISLRKITVDASCGVGGTQLPAVIDAVNQACEKAASENENKKMKVVALEVDILNNVGEGSLNEGCGAEYVQKGRRPPSGWEETKSQKVNQRLCSFDGDGDRLVYHYFDANGDWHLLDGDKQAVLLAEFIAEELVESGLKVNMAMVQTAYANGASSDYARQKGITLDFAKTGVKFVHETADKYDIGVYFEANGHGTALIKGHVVDQLRALDLPPNSRAHLARTRLLALHQLINQAVGDAMSDMLAIEAVLCVKKWSIQEWDATYTDLPSRQCKLPVKDRTIIVCSADETFVVSPAPLQDRLNSLQQQPGYRCFVRPSGTEDVVRVYAEAPSSQEADQLAHAASMAVFELAGGVGEPPLAGQF